MKQRAAWFVICLLVAVTAAPAQDVRDVVPSPESIFGFAPGTDRKLIDYGQLVDYLERVAAASPKVELREIGRSTLDRPMVMAIISAEENIARLDELREINRRLALDPDIPNDERATLVERGRVFVMATLSMHSTEVGPAQTLPILVHELVTADDPGTLAVLDNVVLMVVACLNPDGMDMIVEHYRASLDTAYEGGSMPGLYHHYVGHDNNRDFVSLNLAESRAVSRAYSTEWFPQVLLDKHQMGRTGPRYFVPRYHDPVAENIDGRLWTWSDVFGSAMAQEIGQREKAGVASHWVFDEYWPGATTTSHWKGVISLLTEAASCRLASPVFIEPNELRVRGKGLSEYKKSVNFPDPWPGGWWRLGDIVAYELASWHGALKTASRLRGEILSFRNDLCRDEVARGRTEAPAYYVIPDNQHDPSARDRLVALLEEHGVTVSRVAGEILIGGRALVAGDLVVSLAQPYRPFIKEVMEAQRYPVRHYTPGGEIIKPYDITSWSLPLHMGVEVVEIGTWSSELESLLEPRVEAEDVAAVDGGWGVALDPRHNSTYETVFRALAEGVTVLRAIETVAAGDAVLPAGSFLVEGGLPTSLFGDDLYPVVVPEPPQGRTAAVSMPRIALVETWYHHMESGWTRLILDRAGVDYTLLRPGDVAQAKLAERFDVVIFPDADKNVLVEGVYKEEDEYRPSDYRPEYRKGLGKDGLKAVTELLEAGGRVIAWGEAVEVFLDKMTFAEPDGQLELKLPVHDQAERMAEKGLYAPGSLLATVVLQEHPLTWGMPRTTPVFSRGRPVLGTNLPTLITDRRVVARFPFEGDILVSGYAEHEELLAGQPALVWTRAGRGQLVLFGFQPLFRASVPATYKLFFNAVLLPEID